MGFGHKELPNKKMFIKPQMHIFYMRSVVLNSHNDDDNNNNNNIKRTMEYISTISWDNADFSLNYNWEFGF